MIDFIEGVGFALWSYWTILRTGNYPSGRRRS